MVTVVIIPLENTRSIQKTFIFPPELISVISSSKTGIALIEQVKYQFEVERIAIFARNNNFSIVILIKQPPNNIKDEIISLAFNNQMHDWQFVPANFQ